MKRIRVLVVDDSAFARKVIREVLATDAEIEVVGIARDGLDALERITELKPDVITLDLVMPDLDGIGVLKALPKAAPPRVIVVSMSGIDTELAIEALALGAIDLVTKPTPLATDKLYDLGDELVSKVKMAGRIAASFPLETETPVLRSSQITGQITGQKADQRTDQRAELIVIGTSTGGPQALTELFKGFRQPVRAPIAIALHIPQGFTSALAARLSLLGAVKVSEAENGMKLIAGNAVIAPGGMHLKIINNLGRLFCELSLDPFDTAHHPSVDVLFESAARAMGPKVLGVIMTGMGNDGKLGSEFIREAGGQVFAESSSSCIVYGMPRAVIEAGLADQQAPLSQMSQLIVQSIP